MKAEQNDCALCSLHSNCPDTIFLYATTPILRDIVASHLTELGASYRLDNEIFRIFDSSNEVVHRLRGCLADAERSDIRVTRKRGAGLMAAPLLDQWDRQLATEWFDAALHADAFTTFFQPIVDTRDRRIFAHECLIRLFTDRSYNGGEIIEAAVQRGDIHLFDSYARRLSIRKAAEQHQPGSKVFINFMPSSIYDPAHCMRSTMQEMAKTSLQPSDIVFEVVESEQVRDVNHLKKICDFYRRENFGFALDDVGAGSNSFQMICNLKPEFFKLDKSLISNIADPMYYAAIGKLGEFGRDFGLNVIAEGIEDIQTAEKLQSLGVHLMQGYYFGKPGAQMAYTLNQDLVQLGAQLGSSVNPAEALKPLVS